MSTVDVCVVGMGYIGLPTALVLAGAGQRVHGVDTNPIVVGKLSSGEMSFQEDGLAEQLVEATASNSLTISDEPVPADCYIISVPTPITESKKPDLSFIRNAIRSIATIVVPGNLVILESTSPVGTTELLKEELLLIRADLGRDDLLFAHCPERVIPGKMAIEIIMNDRVVGGLDRRSAEAAAKLYETFSKGEILRTDARTAEMTKLAENSYRDVNIAFANELAILAEAQGVDVWEVIRLANRHPRVQILNPGPGVGGHCIAVDPWFLAESDFEESKLIRTARAVNDFKPFRVVDKVEEFVRENSVKKIGIFGLAFKANVDDLRESPAIGIAMALFKSHPEIDFKVVEPNISELPSEMLPFENVELVSIGNISAETELGVLLVDHSEFRDPVFQQSFEAMMIDTRGIWKAERFNI